MKIYDDLSPLIKEAVTAGMVKLRDDNAAICFVLGLEQLLNLLAGYLLEDLGAVFLLLDYNRKNKAAGLV